MNMAKRNTRTQPRKAAMKKCEPRTKASNFAYPEQTNGSEIAARIRKEANTLTDTEREELFRQGMQIIYGGGGTKEAVRARY